MITNSSNCPGLIPAAGLFVFQLITDTAWLMSPSSVWIGVFKFTVCTVSVHPGCGATKTEAIGVSVGNCTASPVVLAVSLSVGTRNVITTSLAPGAASDALTVTWAEAGPANQNTAPTTPMVTAPATARRLLAIPAPIRPPRPTGRIPDNSRATHRISSRPPQFTAESDLRRGEV